MTVLLDTLVAFEGEVKANAAGITADEQRALLLNVDRVWHQLADYRPKVPLGFGN